MTSSTPFRIFSRILLCTGLLSANVATGQEIGLPNQVWSTEVIRDSGQPVIPLYDGWYPNEDGSKTICFGYFNMNHVEALDIPRGPHNYLETDYPGLDLSGALLPTHFDPLPPRYRHVFCAFTVTVPEGFNTSHRINWHLTANGQELINPFKVIPPYVLDEPASNGRGDIAPLVKTTTNGSAVRGRTGIHHDQVINVRVNEPVSLNAWVEHPEDEVWIGWSHHSGPGSVTFSEKEYTIETADGRATTNATFSEPGQYVVRMQTIDSIAAFEFYCCHTNAYFHVNVSNQ